MRDWNDFDKDAAAAAVRELTGFRKTDIVKLSSVEALYRVIAAARRCFSVIMANAGALRHLPEVKSWQSYDFFRARTDTVVLWAEERIRQRQSVAATREAKAQAAAARTLAKAEAAALLRTERAKANAEAKAARAKAKAEAKAVLSAAPSTRGGYREGATGTPPVRWMAWEGDELTVTVDGEAQAATVTSIARGPVLHATLADGRVVSLAVATRKERPKRRSPRKLESNS